MTLDQLWVQINNEYSSVKSLTRKIQIDLYTASGNMKMWVQDYLWWLATKYSPDLRESMWRVSDVLYYMEKAITTGYAQLDDRINRYERNVEKAFSSNMQNVITYIKQAVDLVWNEATGGGGDLKGYIDSAIAGVQSQLRSEVYAITDMVDSRINSVRNLVTKKYNQVKSWVEDTFGGVWDWITESVDDIWEKSKDYAMQLFSDAEILIAALYNDLEDAIMAVRTWVINYYEELKGYVNALIEETKSFIRKKIKAVRNTIEQVRDEIQAWVDKALSEVMKNVLVIVDTIAEGIDQLSIIADWRFTFMNIFFYRPELSMLQVLTRNDETFNYYKPYWQAFLSRVLEE